MNKHEEFQLLKIQTHFLKVNIHCDGCKVQVRKILHRTEGVFSVSIDVEEQKVTVSGDVDAVTVIRKLNRAGKHAEPWPAAKTSKDQRPNQQKQGNSVCNAVNVAGKIKELSQSSLRQGHKPFRNQKHKLSSSSSDEYDSDYDDDDDKDEDGDEEEDNDYKGQMRNTNAAANNKMVVNSQGIRGSNGGLPTHGGMQQQFPMMVNMQACQSQPPSMANYWIGGHGMSMQENWLLQPQMMYLKSPAMAAYTGYCHCYQSPYYLSDQVDYGYHCYDPSGHENDNACSIM